MTERKDGRYFTEDNINYCIVVYINKIPMEYTVIP
jgi:hypothetical protein